MSNDTLKDVVAAIMESADEVKQNASQDPMDFGQLLAYAEALCIIQDACDPDVMKKIGLDFDVDGRYLITPPNQAT